VYFKWEIFGISTFELRRDFERCKYIIFDDNYLVMNTIANGQDLKTNKNHDMTQNLVHELI